MSAPRRRHSERDVPAASGPLPARAEEAASPPAAWATALPSLQSEETAP